MSKSSSAQWWKSGWLHKQHWVSHFRNGFGANWYRVPIFYCVLHLGLANVRTFPSVWIKHQAPVHCPFQSDDHIITLATSIDEAYNYYFTLGSLPSMFDRTFWPLDVKMEWYIRGCLTFIYVKVVGHLYYYSIYVTTLLRKWHFLLYIGHAIYCLINPD